MSTKQDIINYVTTTPHNTNPTILSQKLDEFAENGGSKDAVQYIQQSLTEEQQMQARANLGLYHKEAVPAENKLIYDCLYITEWETDTDEVAYYISQDDGVEFIILVDGIEYKCLSHSELKYILNVGLVGSWHLGNLGLINKDSQYSNIDCPVCITHDMDTGTSMAIDPNFTPSMGTHVKVFEPSNEMMDVYVTIPEEYLPPLILKDENGNHYTLTVNSDTLELIVNPI